MRPVTVLPTADGVWAEGSTTGRNNKTAYHLVNVEIKALLLSCSIAISFWTEHFC